MNYLMTRRLHLRALPWFLALLAALFFASCGENAEVRSYSAPNHYEGPVVAWKLPEGWEKIQAWVE